MDLLKVRGHGPELSEAPPGVRILDLGGRHTYGCLPGLVGYLRRERPVVMLSDKDRVNRTALLARVLARVPTRLVLLRDHHLHRSGTRGPLERWVQRHSMGRLYPFADQVIVTSAGVADDMAAYTGLARARIRAVPSPVVPEWLFSAELPRPDHPWLGDPATPLILSAGELCRRKGFDTLLRAFALGAGAAPLPADGPRPGGLGRGGPSWRRGWGWAPISRSRVSCPSPMADTADADCFAFSSRWEGLGFVLIEALAVGTPVVSTHRPSGPREVLQDGRYGSLVPVDDDAALAEALVATLDRPLPAQTLREAGPTLRHRGGDRCLSGRHGAAAMPRLRPSFPRTMARRSSAPPSRVCSPRPTGISRSRWQTTAAGTAPPRSRNPLVEPCA